MIGRMQLYYHPFPALSLLAGLILLSLAVFSLFRRQFPGTRLFALLMAAGAEIAILYFFETACTQIETKYLFLKLQFFGAASISVIWLLLAALFAGFRNLLKTKYVILLFIIPVLTVIAVWTNEFHHLFWRKIGIGRLGRIIYMDNKEGYWNWVHLFYSSITFIIGSIFLIRHAVKSKGLHRSQSIAFLCAAVIPWILYILFSLRIFPWAEFDVSPLSFVITGVALWWAIFRYQLLDIMPAAKDIVVDNIRAGVVVTDIQNRVVEINGFIERVFSIRPSEIIGQDVHVLWNRLRLKKESDDNKNEFIFDLEGTDSYFEINIRTVKTMRDHPLGTLILIFDVTEKKKAELMMRKSEEMLYQTQKIEALGRLSDGIAHEFNNILTIVYNYSKYTSPDRESMSEISSAIRRGQELTKQLLTFSRKHIVEKDLISVSAVLNSLRENIRALAPKNIKIDFIEEEDPGVILANRFQIEQLIVNLVKNGIDAMPGGGVLTVVTGIKLLKEESVFERRAVGPGYYAFIQVRDTGGGIEEDVRERIFDPFFTTKDIGKGDGLGLSTVYGIVKQNKGHIDLESTVGKGTVFTVYIPSYSPQD